MDTTNASYVVTFRSGKSILWRYRSPILGHLDMELTERCNFNCIHCYINQPARNHEIEAREMSTDQAKAILTEATSLGALTVRFTGGEPLLRTDFEEIYLFARRLGLRVLLFTNGSLITPHLADVLSRVPPLEEIEITVYGMTAESYEAVTGLPGAFRSVSRGIQLLRDRAVPFGIKGAILPPNRGEIPALEAWAAAIPAMDGQISCSMFFDLRARRDSPARSDQIRKLRLSPKEGVALLIRRPELYRREMEEFCGGFIGPPGDRLFCCGAGHSACVDAYGMAQLCISLRHPATVYDLKGGSLREVLTEFFPSVRQIRTQNPDYLARCAKCFLKGLCEQCPGKAWMEHGTMDAPVEYLCRVAHAQAGYLGLLEEGEQAWEVVDWRERIGLLKSSKSLSTNVRTPETMLNQHFRGEDFAEPEKVSEDRKPARALP